MNIKVPIVICQKCNVFAMTLLANVHEAIFITECIILKKSVKFPRWQTQGRASQIDVFEAKSLTSRLVLWLSVYYSFSNTTLKLIIKKFCCNFNTHIYVCNTFFTMYWKLATNFISKTQNLFTANFFPDSIKKILTATRFFGCIKHWLVKILRQNNSEKTEAVKKFRFRIW